MKQVVVLGAAGMLGSMVHKVLDKVFDVIGGVKEPDADYLPRNLEYDEFYAGNADEVQALIHDADWIINCAGILRPDYRWAEYIIETNALFPYQLQSMARGTPIIQIATDCVFDGLRGSYIESDSHKTGEAYAQTKSLGEVRANGFYNLRCSIVGPELKGKKSLLEWFLSQPQGATIEGYGNYIWNGITTLHFAKLCQGIISNNIKPPILQHIVPADRISKAALLGLFGAYFNRQDVNICTNFSATLFDRTLATDNALMNNILWKTAGYNSPPSIEQMVKELSEVQLV